MLKKDLKLGNCSSFHSDHESPAEKQRSQEKGRISKLKDLSRQISQVRGASPHEKVRDGIRCPGYEVELSEAYEDGGSHSTILSAAGNHWAAGAEEEQVAGR